MSVNLLTRSILATTGAVLSLGAVAINPAAAARITYDFSVLSSTDGSTSFTGRFSYDEATKVVSQYEYQDPSFGWQTYSYVTEEYEIDFIEFSFLDKVYTQADALSPIIWRLKSLNNFPPYEILSWETQDFRFVHASHLFFNFTYFLTNNPYTVDNVAFSRVSRGEEQPTPVPEPSILAAFSVLGLAGLLRKKPVKAEE
jgi:hypothetical protein